MSLQILVLNCGSSSLKFGLYQCRDEELLAVASGVIDRIGQQARFTFRHDNQQDHVDLPPGSTYRRALQFLLQYLQGYIKDNAQLIVGHRVVHGGTFYSSPMPVDSQLLSKLNSISSLAPLHQPYNLAAIEALTKIDPTLFQVACFDSAFHCQHEKTVRQFGIPAQFYEQGIRRYGFHGLSYESIADSLQAIDPELYAGKVIAAHLGNGASLCAMRHGTSTDSSMGFSALDGLLMGTRSGSIDAGVLLYLLQEQGMSTNELTDLLYYQSGLLGVSGISNDMRDLLASDAPAARDAIALYVHRIVLGIGSLAASLGGLDGLVFSGGVGENAAPIRAQVCKKLEWLGLVLDTDANARHEQCMTVPGSNIKVYIIPSNEELIIARHTLQLFQQQQAQGINE